MRIYVISTVSRPEIGGVQNCLDGWMEGLALIGHDVRMLGIATDEMIEARQFLTPRAYAEQWILRPERSPSATDCFLPARKLRTLQFLRARRRAVVDQCLHYVESAPPDYVIFGMLDPVACDVLPYMAARGVPSFCVAYGAEVHPLRSKRSQWRSKSLAQSDGIIAISAYTRDLCLALGVDPRKVAVVHPPLTPEMVNNGYTDTLPTARNDDSLRIVTICRLIERKGVQIIIEAVHRLRPLFPGLHYDIVGDGPFRNQLQETVERYDLSDIVCFHGAIPTRRRNQLLSACDVFVMVPFETEGHDVEGFGIVYLEAGFFQKAVIASRSGGVPDAVLHGETGILVAPGNVEETFAALQDLLSNVDLRNKLGVQGARWAANHTPVAIAHSLDAALLCLSGESVATAEEIRLSR